MNKGFSKIKCMVYHDSFFLGQSKDGLDRVGFLTTQR